MKVSLSVIYKGDFQMVVWMNTYETFEEAMDGIMAYKKRHLQYIGCPDSVEIRNDGYVAVIYEN